MVEEPKLQGGEFSNTADLYELYSGVFIKAEEAPEAFFEVHALLVGEGWMKALACSVLLKQQ